MTDTPITYDIERGQDTWTNHTYDEMQELCQALWLELKPGDTINVYHVTLDGKRHLVETATKD